MKSRGSRNLPSLHSEWLGTLPKAFGPSGLFNFWYILALWVWSFFFSLGCLGVAEALRKDFNFSTHWADTMAPVPTWIVLCSNARYHRTLCWCGFAITVTKALQSSGLTTDVLGLVLENCVDLSVILNSFSSKLIAIWPTWFWENVNKSVRAQPLQYYDAL